MDDSQHRQESLSKAPDWRVVTRLLGYLRPYKWSVLTALALTILNAPLAAAGPLLTKAAVDLFVAPGPAAPSGYVLWLKQGMDFAGWEGSRPRGFAFIAILFLLANVAQSATQYLQVVITENLGQKAIHDLRTEIFRHLQKVSIRLYDHTPVGLLMTSLTTDVNALHEILSSGTITVFSHMITALYAIGWMLRINWSLGLVSFAVLLTMAAFAAWFRKITRPVLRNFRERIAAINVFLQEHLTGMQTIQIFAREGREMQKFKSITGDYWQAATTVTTRNALFYPTIETMGFAGIALIIWYGGGQVMHAMISLGSLVAFIQLAQSFYDPVTEISSKYHVLQAALASSERIFGLLDEPITMVVSDKQTRLGTAKGRIEFRGVWFAYQDEDWILKDVSFIVEPGEKAAFVGQTGAGKTTITNLLLRFYEFQRGQILLDDVDIRQIEIEELRSNFAIVPQDMFLFSGDIASNIRLGNHSIPEEKVRMAAHQVHLDEFVKKLERGYQSEVLERGAGLSIGQKQLVGFARALAFDRPILILDEATSSIDTRTEAEIRKAIRKVMAERTALVIAHRLSTIQAVDKILVMHKGEIRESGDHRSLLARRGIYWKLYQLQCCHDSKTVPLKSLATTNISKRN